MDLVTVTGAVLDLTDAAIRIAEIELDENGFLTQLRFRPIAAQIPAGRGKI
jgi:hypothetical protein